MKKPIIAVTPQCEIPQVQGGWQMLRTNTTYFDAIEHAGGIPIMLPWQFNEEDVARVMEIVDGVVIAGGNDISPFYFGENILEQCGDILPKRDESELLLARFAYKNKIPLLGICRGCQVINVAMGGSLIQDIPFQFVSENGVKLIHSQKNMPSGYAVHRVSISKDSRLYDCFGQEEIMVNSFHHQAAKDVAPSFFASAYAEDGLIEAVEPVAGDSFYVGIQWHPEMMFKNDENSRRLFRYFIDCALG